MSVKRRLILVACVLLLAAACLTFSKESRRGTLYLVGAGQSGPTGIAVVTHGWIRKGRGGWPEDMAAAIHGRTDPNVWLCGYFDWRDGARTVYATHAAKYARDVGGPMLAEEIMGISKEWRHIHLIGHSSGCWLVSEAAKILARKTKADIHLTFFDAYVPAFWDEKSLGDVNAPVDVNCWAEHYYTRDLTRSWTQHDLSFAHNVDITSIDGALRDHNFPWQWYQATTSGKYPKGTLSCKFRPVHIVNGIEYGFARSREASGSDGWKKSLKLPAGNKSVKLKRQRT